MACDQKFLEETVLRLVVRQPSSMSAHVLCLLLLLPLASVAGPDQAPGNAARVLFIGNSLTYTNDLPAMVGTLARAAGRPIHVESVALPDFGLEEHWQQGDARKAIARGGWTMWCCSKDPRPFRHRAGS